jgi:hypothetical protein
MWTQAGAEPARAQLAALDPLPLEADEGAGVAAGVAEDELSFAGDELSLAAAELPDEAVSDAVALWRLSVR